MADWFKIYENDIDEMRLQWAIGELPEVLPVWIVLLSEACRHKDGTLSGYCQDFELFGISKRVNVSIPKVNLAIELLLKISYLKRMDDKSLLIRKWDEKQSEYCQRKTAMQNQKGENNPNHTSKRTKTPESVGTVSGQCPERLGQEERRGEEIRKEYSHEFEMFWSLYPRRIAKANAYREWLKIKPSSELASTIIASLKLQIPNWPDPKYIKHPERWLKAACWEDEVKKLSVNKERPTYQESEGRQYGNQ